MEILANLFHYLKSNNLIAEANQIYKLYKIGNYESFLGVLNDYLLENNMEPLNPKDATEFIIKIIQLIFDSNADIAGLAKNIWKNYDNGKNLFYTLLYFMEPTDLSRILLKALPLFGQEENIPEREKIIFQKMPGAIKEFMVRHLGISPETFSIENQTNIDNYNVMNLLKKEIEKIYPEAYILNNFEDENDEEIMESNKKLFEVFLPNMIFNPNFFNVQNNKTLKKFIDKLSEENSKELSEIIKKEIDLVDISNKISEVSISNENSSELANKLLEMTHRSFLNHQLVKQIIDLFLQNKTGSDNPINQIKIIANLIKKHNDSITSADIESIYKHIDSMRIGREYTLNLDKILIDDPKTNKVVLRLLFKRYTAKSFSNMENAVYIPMIEAIKKRLGIPEHGLENEQTS